MNRFFLLLITFFYAASIVQLSLYGAPKPVIVIEQSRLPSIYVAPISGADGAKLTDVLRNDLIASGAFRVLDSEKEADFTTSIHHDAHEPSAYVLDKDHSTIANAVVHAELEALNRAAMHQFADRIVEEITGKPGIASSQLAFISSATGSKEVYIADIDGANARQLTNDKVISLGPKFSPNGETIAYTSYKSHFPDVWIIDLESKKRKRVAFYPGINCQPAFSPDGRTIALTLSKDGNTELYTIDADGGSPQRLTRTRGTEASPSWSPDGSEIAYVSDDRGTPQIYTIPANGGEPTRIKTASPYATDPAWSPDGKKIAYAARVAGRFQIAMTDLASGQTSMLTEQGDSESPSWTRNSRHLVYARNGALYLLDSFTQKSLKINSAPANCAEPHCYPYLP